MTLQNDLFYAAWRKVVLHARGQRGKGFLLNFC